MKKVTVIVPVYNVESYVKECILSLLEQTYSNLEIIIINDGSTDNSKEICEEIQGKDKRIIYISKKNSGVSDTRNVGIKQSTGDYITFIDSDDFIDNEYIDRMVTQLEECNVDMVVCNYIELYKNSKLSINNNEINDIIITNREAITKVFSSRTFGGYLWNKIFKSEIIKKNKLFFNKDIHMCEDMLFICKYLSNCNNVKIISDKIYFYRMRQSSMVWNKSISKYITLYNSYNEIYKLLYKMNIDMSDFYYMVLNSIFSNDLYNEKIFLDFDILRAYKYVCKSKKIDINQKIKLKLKKYFNFIYKKYMLNKQKKYELYD